MPTTMNVAMEAAIPLARLAVAIDPYPEGQDAAVLGRTLAEATGADLMLVTVEPDLPLVIPGLKRDALRHQTDDMLRRTRNTIAPGARLAVNRDLSIARGLKRLLRTHHRDLLVVGSSRHGAAGQVSMGSSTRQLLDNLHCSLAIAPRGLQRQGQLQLRRIAVGYDGGPESRTALTTAAVMAAAAGADLIVRAIIDDRVPAFGWPSPWLGTIAQAWEQVVEDQEGSLRTELRDVLADLPSIEPEVQVRRGQAAQSLQELSSEVDLIVIGSRRWGALARVVLGGTGERLAHGAHCSLLIVPRSTTDTDQP